MFAPDLTPSVERRLPASCLLITPSVELANGIYGTLARGLGSRVWVWHEPAVKPAVHVLRACKFRLVLLDLTLADRVLGSVLRALKQAAPETPLALLAPGPGVETPLGLERNALGDERARLSGAAAVVPRGDAAALERVVRQILGIPQQET